ncbi:TusE/DsrC/DsvC family sulfur relay protein [Desulfobulbus sp.]|uniref:TusE/DsrC/DsvC family sulfur relay protein n=1 Tax=Desulfobulbus sp. TaxID=895 RepID=UPI0027B8B867|nr:TusE/DsrC/DsvC family sulfur relay protein [Desulfobulbus sp.]
MSTLEYNGKKILVDENGYLANQDDWNEDVACALAAQEGFNSLSTEQMDIIKFMREYFLKYKVFPILNNVCRIAHQPKECVNEQFINPEKAWKIAGLPKQDGVHFISLDGKHYTMEPYC